MALLNRLLDFLANALNKVSGCLLIFMMFTTLADVLTRALFAATSGDVDLTFIGGIEFIKYGLLLTVMFSLPYAVGRSQVIVDLFTDHFSSKTKAWFEGVYMLGFVLMGVAMSYRFFHAVETSKMYGETTQDLLIPLYYFYGICGFAMAFLAVEALRCALRCFFSSVEEPAS